MDALRRAYLLSGCMVGVAALAAAAKHQTDASGQRAVPPNLDANIPKAFESWQVLATAPQLVNPQTKQMLDKLYSEVVSRTYINAQPYAVMLSVAYGHDQRGGLEAHKPEVCYPAQGFVLHEQFDAPFDSPHGVIQTRRLRTSLGARLEPITYWFASADTMAATAWDRRVAQMRGVITGSIPDGILFRVSSIDSDPRRAWRMHEQFITTLLDAVPSGTRDRLLGRQGVATSQ